MIHRGALFLGLLAGMLLVGCAPTPVRPPVADPEAAWAAHRAALEGVKDWRLNGSLAVEAEGEGGQARVDWREQPGGYDIRLSGPLGQGGARLSGDAQGATLSLGNDQTESDPDPQVLLHRHLGWWIPVQALRWWALGLPAPDLAANWTLDDQGRLAKLEQDGWSVRFEAYVTQSGLDLPGKLTVTGRDARVRLVVRRWDVKAQVRNHAHAPV